jgi:hypothetical protein
MKEKADKSGCLIAAVIILCLVLLIGTFIISDMNPNMDTAMTIVGSLIILVGAIVVFNIN